MNSVFHSRYVPLFLAAVTAVIALGTEGARADAPGTINLHGQLLDPLGQPLSGGRAYQVRFFSAETGGVQLGADIGGVAFLPASGLFDLAITLPAQALDAAECWYQLAMDSEQTPNGIIDPTDFFESLVRVHSVPFALRANSVSASGIGSGQLSTAELDALDGITGNVQTQMDAKADQTDVDAALGTLESSVAAKADAANVYTKTEIDAQQSAVNAALSHVIAWTTVTGSVQAEANHGYIANDASEVVFVLPAEGDVAVGDIVRINGIGNGGWRLFQNASQSITIPESANRWVPRGATRFWTDIASSADGQKLVACVQNGALYTSADGGLSWVERESTRPWSSVASSADGVKLVACANVGQIYTSTDSGETWTPRDSERAWISASSSDDGTALQACDYLGYIYTSPDSGVTWYPHDAVRNWVAVDCSASGGVIAAAVNGGQVYVSIDSGSTWDPYDTSRFRIGITISADGSKIAVADSSGYLYTSTPPYSTWTQRGESREWRGLAMSDDGSVIAANVFNGHIYISRDGGATWGEEGPVAYWSGLATSADGTRFAATPIQSWLYVKSPDTQQTAAGGGNFLKGGKSTAIELQYVGGGLFTPLSHEGYIGNE